MAASENGNFTLIILGIILDPYAPAKTVSDIVSDLLAFPTMNDVLLASSRYSGRWVAILIAGHEDLVFTDPCGFRSVFYVDGSQHFWIGSQPVILSRVTELRRNQEPVLTEFLESREFAKREQALLGPETGFSNCFRLLPNQALRMAQRTTFRHFPHAPVNRAAASGATTTCASILEGTIAALTRQFPSALALTAGWDSRLLLAASRQCLAEVSLYVDRMGLLPEEHMDIGVPTNLCRQLNLNFCVLNSKTDVPDWMAEVLVQNMGQFRRVPKLRAVYGKWEQRWNRVNINGNGSEITRNTLDRFCSLDATKLSVPQLCHLLHCENSNFAKRIIGEWRLSGELICDLGYNILDFLYWEQQMGCWSSIYPGEQDIIIDEISPFNNRDYLSTMLAVDRKRRSSPTYNAHSEMIDKLWPELRRFPFNPDRRKYVNSVARYFPRWARRYITLNYNV